MKNLKENISITYLFWNTAKMKFTKTNFFDKILQQGLDLFYPLLKGVLSFHIYRYLAVGGVCFLVNFIIFHLSYHYLKQCAMPLPPHVVALFCSLSVTIFLGYYLNSRFVFSGSDSYKNKQFLRYSITTIVSVIASVNFLNLLVNCGLNITLSFLLNVATVQFFNYFVQKRYSFKPNPSEI